MIDNSKTTPTYVPLDLSDNSPRGQMAIEAHHMRRLLREITNRITIDLEGEIVRMIELAGDVPEKESKTRQIREMVSRIQRLEMKPRKGRIKDLKQIQKTVRDINLRLEELL